VNKAVTENLSYLTENKCVGLEAYLFIFLHDIILACILNLLYM